MLKTGLKKNILDLVPKELLCSICSDVFKNPTKCQNGHCFCRDCYTKELSLKSKCPTCHEIILNDDLVSDFVLGDQIGKLKVKCPEMKCDWKGTVNELDWHLSTQCEIKIGACPYGSRCVVGNCQKVLKRDSLSHMIQSFTHSQQQSFTPLTLENGDVYCGEVNQTGTMHGHGIFIRPDLSFYHGHFCDNEKSGFGFQKYPNGDTYLGHYFEGKRNGRGDFQWVTGDFYSGDWLDDLRSGHGVSSSPNGDSYQGEWKSGRRSGYGVMKFNNGLCKYTGMWMNNQRHGKGEQISKIPVPLSRNHNYYTYDGDWVRDEMTGQGVLTYANHFVYDGGMLKGRKHGVGKFRDLIKCRNISGSWDDDTLYFSERVETSYLESKTFSNINNLINGIYAVYVRKYLENGLGVITTQNYDRKGNMLSHSKEPTDAKTVFETVLTEVKVLHKWSEMDQLKWKGVNF